MKLLLPALASLFVFVSCVPSTPDTRIQQQPEKFNRLTLKQKSLVRQGQITQGMPPEAVELAWGYPDRRSEGSRNGKFGQRWDYEGSRPVYSTGFYDGFGYGWGRFYPALSLGPDIAYVPYTRASVWFVGNKVDAWERIK
ncbi:MAG: hypothetical protein QM680_05145 [Luteolibacter sp.]